MNKKIWMILVLSAVTAQIGHADSQPFSGEAERELKIAEEKFEQKPEIEKKVIEKEIANFKIAMNELNGASAALEKANEAYKAAGKSAIPEEEIKAGQAVSDTAVAYKVAQEAQIVAENKLQAAKLAQAAAMEQKNAIGDEETYRRAEEAEAATLKAKEEESAATTESMLRHSAYMMARYAREEDWRKTLQDLLKAQQIEAVEKYQSKLIAAQEAKKAVEAKEEARTVEYKALEAQVLKIGQEMNETLNFLNQDELKNKTHILEYMTKSIKDSRKKGTALLPSKSKEGQRKLAIEMASALGKKLTDILKFMGAYPIPISDVSSFQDYFSKNCKIDPGYKQPKIIEDTIQVANSNAMMIQKRINEIATIMKAATEEIAEIEKMAIKYK